MMTLLKKTMNNLGFFNAAPAAMIDRLYLNEPRGFFKKAWHFIKIRAVYAFVFLPLSLVDLFVCAALALRFALGTLFVIDDRLDLRLNQQKKYASQFSKVLYSLAAFLFGLASPKLTVFNFTPEQTKQDGVRAGGHYYQEKDAELVSPSTVDELKAILRSAKQAGKKVMPIGAGFSQGKQFLPEGQGESVVIDLSEFNRVEVNSSDKTVTVGAGATWAQIQDVIDKHGLALKVMQASNVFSVGGSIGTNIHGWDHRTGTLANTVLSLDIVDANGEARTLRPGDDLFHQVIGGFGLFGIVTQATIQLRDNVLLREQSTDVPIADYASHFQQKVQGDEQIQMHLYRLSLDPAHLLGSGVAVNYVQESPTPVRSTSLRDEEGEGSRFNRMMVNIGRRLDWARAYYWKKERERLLLNNGPTLSTNEVMRPPIKAMFNHSVSEAEWLQEYFLPPERLAEFLQQLGALLMANEVCLINASVRFVKQHEGSFLSYAAGGDRFAVVLCFNQSFCDEEIIKAKKWLRQAQHLAVEHGGTYYLPYQHISSPEDFRRAYPRAQEAFDYKQEVDSQGLFYSGLYQKFIAPNTEGTNYFRVVMDNEATKKKFSGFLKYVLQRVDSKQFFALLSDVMKYNDSHAEIYQELSRRLPEVMPGTLGSLKRILNSLSAIKKDLAAQAHALLPETLQEINGLVEIGYPGRFIAGFRRHYQLKGRVVAVYEEQSLTDYIQTGFPRPYDQFVRLDYKEPNLRDLDDNSADVVTCYVGLHHFPEDKLDAFLKDVRRILRDGGHFILVDHDVVDGESMAMAHMAHMIFNAVSGTSLDDELSEIRNFQPMSYWAEKLNQHGLASEPGASSVITVRAGDPTSNRMMTFTKNAPEISAGLAALSAGSAPDSVVYREPVHSEIFEQGRVAPTVPAAPPRVEMAVR